MTPRQIHGIPIASADFMTQIPEGGPPQTGWHEQAGWGMLEAHRALKLRYQVHDDQLASGQQKTYPLPRPQPGERLVVVCSWQRAMASENSELYPLRNLDLYLDRKQGLYGSWTEIASSTSDKDNVEVVWTHQAPEGYPQYDYRVRVKRALESGEPLVVEVLDAAAGGNGQPAANRIGHQGLPFHRLDGTPAAPPLVASDPLTGTGYGLYFNRARWYEPSTGRFLQADMNETALSIASTQAMGGQLLNVLVSPLDPQGHFGDGMNLFGYVDSNPVNSRDPSGLSEWDDELDSIINEYAYGLYRASAQLAQAKAGIAQGAMQAALYATASFLWGDLVWDLNENALFSLAFGGFGARVCFEAGTPVVMADGSLQAIEEVGVGEWVLAFDERTAELQAAPVVRRFERIADRTIGLVFAGAALVTTPEHPFFVEECGWTRAADLQPGERVVAADGSAVPLVTVGPHPGPVIVYNLEVAGQHTYFVTGQGLLVHNECLFLGSSKGHHVIPKWAGGKARQWMHRLDWTGASGAHKAIERSLSVFRTRVLNAHGLRGNLSGKDLVREMRRNPQLRRDIFEELERLYAYWDAKYNTELVEALRRNIQMGYFD